MSAPNFKTLNAQCVYARRDEDDYDFTWDILQDEVRCLIDNGHKEWSEDEGSDRDRSYPMAYIMSRTFTEEFGGQTFYAEARVGCRAGYFGGANLDYEVELSDGYGYNESCLEGRTNDVVAEEFVHYADLAEYGWNAGLAKMLRMKLTTRLVKFLDRVQEECEDICKALCDDELVCVGIFSNGEAIYEHKSPRAMLKNALMQ